MERVFRAGLSAALALLAGTARTQSCSLERASVDALGVEGDLASGQTALSADGRYLVFTSSATNLVPGDTNQLADLFLRDLALGSIERIGLGPGGAEGDGSVGYPALSADGRYVAFNSNATNLVAGDANGTTDVFVLDRHSGALEIVSVGPGGIPGDGPSFAPSITPDGRFVVFSSWATNLAGGDTNGTRDVFLRDRASAATELVSASTGGVPGNGMSGGSTLSCFATGDGRLVAFTSAATNLVPADTNGAADLFLRDRVLGTVVRAVLAIGGAEPDDDVDLSALSPDGRFVAFSSAATNLVPGDNNGATDAFVLDRESGLIERLSVSSAGTEGSGASFAPVISHDGRIAVFTSSAEDLVPGDTNLLRDAFRRDRAAGSTERWVSTLSGGQPSGDVNALGLDAVAGRLAFQSAASALVIGDTNGVHDVFVRTCSAGVAFCFGDGSATACPCGNVGAWNAGCANSVGTGGALATEGEARTSFDTLTLVARGLPPGAPTLFFQGSSPFGGGQGTAFGDGLRCLGGTIVRLGTRPALGGAVAWGFGVPGSLLLSVQGNVPAGGDFRWYQAWYRNAASFCTVSTFNLTNGLEVTWWP